MGGGRRGKFLETRMDAEYVAERASATSVDEAIGALHEPSPVEVALVEVSRLEAERQKLEVMRQRARTMRLEVERELQQAAAMRKQAEWERIESMRVARHGAVVR